MRAGGKQPQTTVRTIRNESTRELVARAIGREDGLTGKPVGAVGDVVERVNQKCGVPWRDVAAKKSVRTDVVVEIANTYVRDMLKGEDEK